jgi:hypothetical protein
LCVPPSRFDRMATEEREGGVASCGGHGGFEWIWGWWGEDVAAGRRGDAGEVKAGNGWGKELGFRMPFICLGINLKHLITHEWPRWVGPSESKWVWSLCFST